MDVKMLQLQLDTLFATHQYDKIEQFLKVHHNFIQNNDIFETVLDTCKVYEQEKAAGKETVFSKVDSVEGLIVRHTCLKFLLRRLEYGVLDNGVDELYQFLTQYQVSSYELIAMIDFAVIHKEAVWEKIKGT